MNWFNRPKKLGLTELELEAFLQQERLVADAKKNLQMLLAAHAIFKEQVREKYKMESDFLIDAKTGELIKVN